MLRYRYLGWRIFWLLALAGAPTAQAQISSKLTTLHKFSAPAPASSLVLGSDANFYGTTVGGGASGFGSVFKVTPAGAITTLYSFADTDGSAPKAALIIGSDGDFYGTTSAGGSFGNGTVFKITSAGVLTTLHRFSALNASGYNGDGTTPLGALVLGSNGIFYGTASVGGLHGLGTLFQMTSNGTVSTIYHFGSAGADADGATPLAGLVEQSAGVFYGTASGGGKLGYGTIFKITSSRKFSVVHPFDFTDGWQPKAPLIVASDGNLYGTTYAGGASNDNGVAFQLTPAGAYKVIFYFDLSEEYAFPAAALLEGSPGVFYSVASAGGDANKGVVYQLTSTGSFSFLHSFAEDGSEGTSPQSALIKGPNGDLYSTVAQGGTGDAGTIYQVTTGGTLSVLDELANPTGETPVAALTAAPNGSFYGITSHGGAYLKGTIFRITTAGVTSVVHTFTGPDGRAPMASLLLANDGNFYGTTSAGGTYNNGTVFKLTPAGVLTTLHRFSALSSGYSNGDGTGPQGALIQATDGDLYGTAAAGGGHGQGTLFKITTSGVFTPLYYFGTAGQDADGAEPLAGLLQASDGNFYGTASLGGRPQGNSTYDAGIVFRFTQAHVFTTLLTFTEKNGDYPAAALIEASDGNLYGSTEYGGSSNQGTIFKVVLSTGAVSTFYDFANSSYPAAALLQGQDMNLYGTTSFGQGTVFQLTLGGAFSVVHTFAPSEGSNPTSSLVQTSNGDFYGTTNDGTLGVDRGSVYELTVNQSGD